MKRNYIDRLKEYDARTSLKHKQSLYSRKFIKTCYNGHNKQNQDPNLRKNISLKSDKKSQAQETKSSEKRDCEARAREVSQFKELSSPCLEAKKAILTSLRLQCVNWQRYLSLREAEEVEKCKLYYQAIQDQLSKQQLSNVSFIHSLYSHNKRLIQDKMALISEQLDCVDFSLLQMGNSPLLFKQLLPQDTSIELQMAAVVLNAEVLRQAIAEIAKFDLMHLGFLQKSQQQHSQIPPQQTKKQVVPWIDQSLSCPQELIDGRDTRKIINQLDISFQNCQEFQPFGLTVCVAEAEKCSISPSFKHF